MEVDSLARDGHRSPRQRPAVGVGSDGARLVLPVGGQARERPRPVSSSPPECTKAEEPTRLAVRMSQALDVLGRGWAPHQADLGTPFSDFTGGGGHPRSSSLVQSVRRHHCRAQTNRHHTAGSTPTSSRRHRETSVGRLDVGARPDGLDHEPQILVHRTGRLDHRARTDARVRDHRIEPDRDQQGHLH